MDITANNGFLQTALRCMSLIQMVMQGRWHHDNTLLQLPHLEKRHLPGLASKGIECLAHFLHCNRRKAHQAVAECFSDLPDDELFDVMGEVFEAANHFPRVDVQLTTEIAYPEEEEEMEEEEVRWRVLWGRVWVASAGTGHLFPHPKCFGANVVP